MHVSLNVSPACVTQCITQCIRYNSLVLTEGSRVMATGFKTCIIQDDLRRLATGGYLNAELMNYYNKLLVSKFSSEVKKIYCFETWFATKLLQAPDLTGFKKTKSPKWNNLFTSCNYAGVQRWTVKVDLFRYQIILIPMFIKGDSPETSHFQMCVVRLNRELKETRKPTPVPQYNYKINFAHCCSLEWPFGWTEKTHFKNYFLLEHKRHHGSWLNNSVFTFEKADVPKQENGVDCGVHVCANAYATCVGFALDDRIPIANLETCNEFRKHMALSIVDNQIKDRFRYRAERMTLETHNF